MLSEGGVGDVWLVGSLLFIKAVKSSSPRLRPQMENAGYELERLHTDVTSLCSRIELLPCSTAKDRLAQSGKRTTATRSPAGSRLVL